MDEPNDDSSVMDRTRQLWRAREDAKKKAQVQQVAEEEAAHFDQLVLDAREKVEATKVAKLRTAESRRILKELQSELASKQAEADSDPGEVESQFVSKVDIGSLLVSSLQSVVSNLF